MHKIPNWNDFSFKEHIFFNCKNSVDNIIRPLIKHFELDSVVFQKFYNDGSEIALTNQPQWLEHFYKKRLYKKSMFTSQPDSFKEGAIVWANIPEKYRSVLHEAKKFNIDYGLTLTIPVTDGVEFYCLGNTSNNPEIVERYISNFDLLKKFVPYFQQAAGDLITQAYKHRMTIRSENLKANNNNSDLFINRSQFLRDIMSIRFTNREMDCAQLLVRGYTVKMIALQLKISPRTVEEYINNLKNKTTLFSKNELVSYLNKWLN